MCAARRRMLLFLLVLLMLVMPTLFMYQKTYVYADAVVIAQTCEFIVSLIAGGSADILNEFNDDVVTLEEYMIEMNDFYDATMRVVIPVYGDLQDQSKYVYEKLATGIENLDIKSLLTPEQITQADNAVESITSKDVISWDDLESYEYERMLAQSVSNYLTNNIEKAEYRSTFIDGYSTINDTYHFEINDNVSDFYSMGDLINSNNTFLKVENKHSTLGADDVIYTCYQYFTSNTLNYKLMWQFVVEKSDITDNTIQNSDISQLWVGLYRYSTSDSKYKELVNNSAYPGNDLDAKLADVKASLNSVGVDTSYLNNKTFEDLVSSLNLGLTGTLMYSPPVNTVIGIPELDYGSVCADGVQDVASSANDSLENGHKKEVPWVWNPGTGDTTVGGVTVGSAGDISAGSGSETGTGTDLTVPSDVTFNFEPLTKFGHIFTTKFPFCIPWDMKRAIENLVVPPEAPRWVITFDKTYFTGGGEMVIDFAQFEELAKIVRWGVFIIFSFGLMLKTRDIIKG